MSTIQTRRSTRSTTKTDPIAAAAIIVPSAAVTKAKTPAKKAPAKKKTAVLADVTNASTSDAMEDICAPVKPSTGITMTWDVDALTAEKDVEVAQAPVATVVPIVPTTIVPAQPQLTCAIIDQSITALRVVRAPIPAFVPNAAAVENGLDSDDEPIQPSSRRVQLVYGDNGELIGQQEVAPIGAAFDEEEQEDEEDESLDRIERMTVEGPFVAPAPLELDHAAPLARREVQGTASYSSGFLPAGVVSASTIRSVKLDTLENLPAYIFATPASTSANVAKVSGFVHGIDANRIQSKKL